MGDERAMRDLYKAMYDWRGEQIKCYEAVIRCLCDDDPDGARRALLPLLPKDHPGHGLACVCKSCVGGLR